MIAERKKTPLRFLAVLLVVLMLLTGCSSKSKKALQQIKLGQKYLTEQNYTEAVASFTEAIRLAPENIQAYQYRAAAYQCLNQYDEAKADYTVIIEKTEKRPYVQAQAYANRGVVWIALGDQTAARADYTQAVKVLGGMDLSGVSDTVRQDVKTMLEQLQATLDSLGGAADIGDENGADDGAENTAPNRFQQIMDSIEVPSEYASCKRYVLVNDYDGDGREEAFGYFGLLDSDGTGPVWNKLYIYFISAEGQVTCVYDPRTETEEKYLLCGRPVGTTSSDPTSFSGCYVTGGGQTFALMEIKFLGFEGSFFQALTVTGGKPAMLNAPFDLRQATDGFFVGGDFDDYGVYVFRNGDFEQVGQVACAEMDAQNGAFTDKNTPEAAWKKYESSVRKWEEDTEGYDTSTVTSRVITADYDGDGRQEAYAILQEPADEWGTNWAHVYYISPNGYIVYMRGYTDAGAMYGVLRDSDKADPLLSAGNQKFLLWDLYAGSAMPTLLFGVKDGVPYEPEVSGGYDTFRQKDGGGYAGDSIDFSKGYRDYIEHNFTFDAASGQFKKK